MEGIDAHYEELIEDRVTEFFYMVRDILTPEEIERVREAFLFARIAPPPNWLRRLALSWERLRTRFRRFRRRSQESLPMLALRRR